MAEGVPMHILVAALLVLAGATSLGVPGTADPGPPTWGRFVRDALLAETGALPTTVTVNGIERPFADALSALDGLAGPHADGLVAPTKDLGFGNSVGAHVCSVGAFVAAYASAPNATTPPPTFVDVEMQEVSPATMACGPNEPFFIGAYSADLAPMPGGGNRAMNSCVYGPGAGWFLNPGTICHQGFQGTVAFERFTIAGSGLWIFDFSGCSGGSCWRFSGIGAYATSTPLPGPGAAVISLDDTPA